MFPSRSLFDELSSIVQRPRVCPACNGDGWEFDRKDSDSLMRVPCPACNGTTFATPDKPSGETRKRVGQARTLEKNSTWADIALDLFRSGRLGSRGTEITSDDLRRLMPDPESPNVVGAVFTSARKLGLISRTGRSVPSNRSDAHGRLIQTWRINNVED
jgi:hypothetical protein